MDIAITIIRDKLLSDQQLEDRTAMNLIHICHVIELCLKSTHFHFEDVIYEQKDRTAMGYQRIFANGRLSMRERTEDRAYL